MQPLNSKNARSLADATPNKTIAPFERKQSHDSLFLVSEVVLGRERRGMLTQSLSFFVAGIPISSNVAGPCFFGGPDDAEVFEPGPAEYGPEGVCEGGAGDGLPCADGVGDGLEPYPCEDIAPGDGC
jgi:hypothetical protein